MTLSEAIEQFRALDERMSADDQAYVERMKKRKAAYANKDSACKQRGGAMRWGKCVVRGKVVPT